jgi:hypothetical protein
MKSGWGKALYIFLCTLLGIILFLIFHRALVVIAYILIENNYQPLAWGLTNGDLQTIDFFTMLVALFLGGWYGVWLGLNWYALVYEGEHSPGLLHGFLPHHYRRAERMKRKAARASQVEPEEMEVSESAADKISNLSSSLPWDLDDLDDAEMVKKPVRKKVVRKTTKRTKKVDSES